MRKRKRLIWTIAAAFIGLIVIFGLGKDAITNAKDLFKKEETPPAETEESVDDTTTQASVDYDYDVVA